MQEPRQRIVGRRQCDRVKRAGRGEGHEIRRVIVVREHERRRPLDLVAERGEVTGGQEGARPGADDADAVDVALVHDALELGAEVERLGTRSHGLRAGRRE